MYALFTDTDCDVTPEIASRFGYHLISLPYIENGKEVYPYEDWLSFDSHAFYEKLRHGPLLTTCGISSLKYTAYFEPFFKANQDILYVHFSAAMSGTFSAMNLAVEELKKKYPGVRFETIDTKGITIGSLNIVEEIGDLYVQGKSIDEIKEWAKTEVDKFAIYFYADNLKFFAKSGRVSGITAAMGGLIGMHPIIYMNSEGQMVSIGKAVGRVSALNKVMDYVIKLQDHIQDHRVIIAHTDCLFLAERMGHLLRQHFGRDLHIDYVVVSPIPGAHCGPDCIGVSFHAIHR
jgi:DegV family protein with EDD domain